MKKKITGVRTLPYKDYFIVQVDRFTSNPVPRLETRYYKYKYSTKHIYTVVERFTNCILILNLRIVQEMKELNNVNV